MNGDVCTWFTGVRFIDCAVPRGLCPGDVVEVFGESGSGKSELLMQLAIKCVLPRAVGGSDASVVVCDVDGKFDAERLLSLLLERLRAVRGGPGGLPFDVDQLDSVCRRLLRRVHVIRPRDVTDLIVALRALPTLVSRVPTRLLLIDSVSAWFWRTRFDTTHGAMYERDVTRFVRELADEQKLVVVASKQVLFDTRPSVGVTGIAALLPAYQEYSCADWAALVRLRITLAAEHDSAGFVAALAHNSSWRGRTRDEPIPPRSVGRFIVDECGLEFVVETPEDDDAKKL